MKAIKLVIVILITITLSGCSTSKELSHDLNKEDENERNIYEETEEILSGSFSGSILIRFESIKEMIECKFCGFVEIGRAHV